MSDYPHVQALLVSLLQLDEQDRELPLPLLINLHRAELRLPLAGLLAIGPDSTIVSAVKAVNGITTNFERAYMRLGDGRIFEHSQELETIYESLPNLWLIKVLPEEFKTVPAVEELFRRQDKGWYAYDPVLTLHELTWSNEICQALLPQLEVELGLDSVVGDMLVQLARVAKSLQVPILGYNGIDTFETRAARHG
jgi:hypothetical protein